jgi:hypothetical protein
MGMRLGIKYGFAPPSNCLQNLLENGFVKRVDVRSSNKVDLSKAR